MKYAEIKPVDIANCVGVGVSLYVSGCRNHCEGCFNPETWDFNYGEIFTVDTITEILQYCDKGYISTLTILGGDPMEPENRHDVLRLCIAFRNKFKHNKKLWLYTGYLYETLIKQDDAYDIISQLDVIVDGKYEKSKADLNLRLKGSANQRIIDVAKTLLDDGNIVEYKFFDWEGI